MGSVDNRYGAPGEISADAPSISVLISKMIQIWDGRKKVAVEIQKTLCEGRNIENLIKSTCFISKLVKSTCFVWILVESACFAMTIVMNYYQSLRILEFPDLYIVENLTKNQKVNI